MDEKDGLSEEEIATRVEEIKRYTDDLPDSEDKSAVIRFLEDCRQNFLTISL